MDPKFVTLDDAAQQLSISPDQLNALREQGKLRAYRDGSSWKFRTEDIERMVAEGVPQLDEESGINLDLDDLTLGEELSLDDPSGDDVVADDFEMPSDAAAYSDIQLVDDDDDELELSTGSSADVSLNLDDEPAVASADDELDLELDSGDDPESILLSEAELGDSPDRPPSTIIGRAELDDALDLELASDDSKAGSTPPPSDVELADLEDLDSDTATGEIPTLESVTDDFDNIEELEIDLEAESSRILSPEDVAAAQAAAGNQAQQKAPETSDLDLDLDDEYGLVGSDTGLTGLSGLETDDPQLSGSEIDLSGSSAGSGNGLSGLSALELDDEDDFVLGDGSDVTLSAADSGINLSPADSGLSLDDAALDLGGSSIGSGIDFGEASGLVSDEPADAFDLTPMEEDASADDEDDSSQVIALDAFEEHNEADDLLGAGEPADAGMGASAMPAGAGFSQTAVVPRAELQFSTWNVVFLALSLLLLSLCGMMVLDVIRSMWSWGEPYAVNSSLIDSLSGFLFP